MFSGSIASMAAHEDRTRECSRMHLNTLPPHTHLIANTWDVPRPDVTAMNLLSGLKETSWMIVLVTPRTSLYMCHGVWHPSTRNRFRLCPSTAAVTRSVPDCGGIESGAARTIEAKKFGFDSNPGVAHPCNPKLQATNPPKQTNSQRQT